MAAVTAAVVGIASGVGGAVMSFKQASDQKRLAEESNRAAQEAMEEARSNIQKDFFEGLNVPLDAFEKETETNLQQQKEALTALQEGDSRQLSANVGRIGALQGDLAEKQRIAMGEELFELDKLKRESKDDINQQLVQMDVAFARDSMKQRQDALEAQNAAIQSGISGISQAATSAADLVPLYQQARNTRRASKVADKFSDMTPKGMNQADFIEALEGQNLSRKQYKQLMDMNPTELMSEGFKFDFDN